MGSILHLALFIFHEPLDQNIEGPGSHYKVDHL